MYIVTKNIAIDTFGYYSKIFLYAQYVGLVHFGFISSASRLIPISPTREMPIIINSTLFLEGVQAAIIIMLLAIVGLTKEQFLYVIPVFLGQRISAVLSSILVATKSFKHLNQYRLIYGVLSPLLAIVVVMFITPTYYLIYILVGAICILPILIRLIFKNEIEFSLSIVKDYLHANLLDGMRLQFRSLSFWGYRLADGLVVSIVFSSSDYGIYAFAVSLVLYLRLLLGDAHNLMQPYIWKWLDSGHEDTWGKIYRLNQLFMVGSILICIFSMLSIPYFIQIFLPKYVDSIVVFKVLIFNVMLIGSTGVMTIVGSSKTFDLINITRNLYIGGMICYLVFYMFAKQGNLNILTVAQISVVIQFLILASEWLYGLHSFNRVYRIFSGIIFLNMLGLFIVLWY